jgi:hypothetical protein
LTSNSRSKTQQQQQQASSSFQIGDNGVWEELLSIFQTLQPNMVHDFKDWLQHRVETGQEQEEGDNGPHVAFFGIPCPLHFN